LGWKGPLEVT